ncbi:MAG: transcription termination/antitermination protein NusA [Ruminococcaceae bacterium]|nr:transcription termination/antitermination protein NusA [Oscillospiraceae bacterium]
MASNKELFEALRLLEKEKGIPVDYMIAQIKRAIVSACKNLYGGNENVDIKMDPEKNAFAVKIVKTVVEEVEDENFEIALEDAKLISKRAAVGKELGILLEPKKFGRIAVQTARSVIRQGIRDGEKGQMLVEFQSKQQEIATATVERVDPVSGNATIRFGKAETVLPKSEQIGDEILREGDTIKVYVAGVKEGDRGPRAIISRTHPDFVKRLFEKEVPEIFDGIVEIKSVSREAGSRTKMAVYSDDGEVDAVGACIGTRGARVNAIVDELKGEKIDIVLYSDDPVQYVAAALSPATVVGVEVIDAEAKSCKATVPDGQLSLAIGNKGQNVRLAAKLTGWKIDIRPESGFWGEDTQDESEA